MVRIGVVGAGIWGTMHVRAYAQNPLVELVGICDLDEERATNKRFLCYTGSERLKLQPEMAGFRAG